MPRKLSSLPILSCLSPSRVTLKLPTGVGIPGFWSAVGTAEGVISCAPAPRMVPGSCGLSTLLAFPAA
jgi:hypothetical protein